MNTRALALALTLLASPALAHDWAPECSTERAYRWFRPDQPRDSWRDAPEHEPRLPHERAVGAGRQHGFCPPQDEAIRQREFSQWLSQPDDEIGYRGLCVLHHSGPHCRGDNTPLPCWLPDSPDEPWTRSVPREDTTRAGTWRTRSPPPARTERPDPRRP